MKRGAAAIVVVLSSLACARSGAAQEADGWVLPPGMLRVWSGGAFRHFDSRFVADGDATVPLAAELLRPLTAASFPPLRPLESRLAGFLAATSDVEGAAPVPVDATTLRLGTPDLQISVDERVVPFGVRVGVRPRLELGLRVPIVQRERLVQRSGLVGSTVGLNPDTAGNRQLLAQVDAAWAELGGGRLLPTDSSALGRELQRRVLARTGRELDLPVDSLVGPAVLGRLLEADFGLPPLESAVGNWELGDVELGGRFQLLSTLPEHGYPVGGEAGPELRSAISLGVRLPTGSAADSLRLFGLEPSGGRTGLAVGTENDLFYGERFWGSLTARYTAFAEREVERRLVPPDAPLSSTEPPRTVRWSPGAELEVRVTPRYRLTEEIALGAHYAFLRRAESAFAVVEGTGGAGLLDTEAATAQRAGASARYTTLPAHARGAGLLPIEVSLDFSTTLGGGDRTPDARTIVIQASIFDRLWGGGR